MLRFGAVVHLLVQWLMLMVDGLLPLRFFVICGHFGACDFLKEVIKFSSIPNFFRLPPLGHFWLRHLPILPSTSCTWQG